MVVNVPVMMLRQVPIIQKVRKTVEVHQVQLINDSHGAVSCEFFSSSGTHCCVCPRPVVALFVVAFVSLVSCILCDSTSINDRLNERCLEGSRPSVCPSRYDPCDFTALKIVHASGVRFLHFPPPAQVAKYPFSGTLSVSRSRVGVSFKVFGVIGPLFLSDDSIQSFFSETTRTSSPPT